MPSLNTISYPVNRDNNDENETSGSSNRFNRIRSRLENLSERFHNFLIRWRWPNRERNLVAAFFTLLALTVLSASLADEEWVYLEGGNCRLKHIGLPLFYGWGVFQKQYGSSIETTIGDQVIKRPRIHIIYTVGNEHYTDCVDQRTADIFHGLMGVLFVAVATTMAAFFMDIIGVKQGFLAWLRRNSVFSIFSVIFCVIIIGLTYWISIQIENLQRESVSTPEMVHVSFEDGFYLIIAGAAFSICSLVANLVKTSIEMKRRCDDRLSLLEHAEQNEAEVAAVNAAVSRENLLQYYHHYRRRLMQMPTMPAANVSISNSRSAAGSGLELAFGSIPVAGSGTPLVPIGANAMVGQPVTPAMLIAERPIGSTGPPPPLQMLLNVPPPPPYSP